MNKYSSVHWVHIIAVIISFFSFSSYSFLSHLVVVNFTTYSVGFPSIIPFVGLNCLIFHFKIYFCSFVFLSLCFFFCTIHNIYLFLLCSDLLYFPWLNWNCVSKRPIKLWHFNTFDDTSQLHVSTQNDPLGHLNAKTPFFLLFSSCCFSLISCVTSQLVFHNFLIRILCFVTIAIQFLSISIQFISNFGTVQSKHIITYCPITHWMNKCVWRWRRRRKKIQCASHKQMRQTKRFGFGFKIIVVNISTRPLNRQPRLHRFVHEWQRESEIRTERERNYKLLRIHAGSKLSAYGCFVLNYMCFDQMCSSLNFFSVVEKNNIKQATKTRNSGWESEWETHRKFDIKCEHVWGTYNKDVWKFINRGKVLFDEKANNGKPKGTVCMFDSLIFSHHVISVVLRCNRIAEKNRARNLICSICERSNSRASIEYIRMNELTCDRSRMWVNVNKSVNQQQQNQHEFLSILNTPWRFNSDFVDCIFRQH